MRYGYTIAVLAGSASIAAAQGPAVTSFAGGSNFGGYYAGSTGDVVGFRFTADVDMTVTDLGVQNDPADGLLDADHMVGIWRNSDMVLLTSATCNAASTLLNGFMYESITPVTLTAGEVYTIGAMYSINDGDSYTSSPTSVSTDGISGTNGVFPTAASLGFVYPEMDSTNLARFGPNFIWEAAQCAADWNGDGILNTTDFLDFLNDYNLARGGGTPIFGDPDLAPPAGVINTADFLAFLNVYNAGC